MAVATVASCLSLLSVTGSVLFPPIASKAHTALYSKELSLRNQPLETQRWILAQFLGNWLAAPQFLINTRAYKKLSADFGCSFLETG